MNIQTDVHVDDGMLSRCSWVNLCTIAQKGSTDQRNVLLAWAHTELPAFLTQQLREMAALAAFCGV